MGGGGCGQPEVVFLVNLICTPQRGGEGEEVQMEKCLVGDTGGGDGGWDIRWVGIADVDNHVFTEVCVWVCVLVT